MDEDEDWDDWDDWDNGYFKEEELSPDFKIIPKQPEKQKCRIIDVWMQRNIEP